MTALRILLAVMALALMGFTACVIAHHGLNLLPIFFGDIARGGWPGQFNADFLTFLTLSGLWTAWRNGFGGMGLGLGLVAFFMGGGFLLPYLLYLLWQARGDMARVLLGVHFRESV